MAESNRIFERRGFEALLRPIQDVIAKDWKLKLKNFLDHYLIYLQKLAIVDFSEAALIVQNTCTYYSRRVDLMYNWVSQFCLNLTKEEESIEKDGAAQKKRTYKKKNDFLFDFLEKFDCSSTANMQRAPLQKHNADVPSVKLNTNMKPMCKPNISCPIWQLNNDEMGHKDDFQLCGTLLNNGRLYQEIIQRNIFIDEDTVEVEEESVTYDDFCQEDSPERSLDKSGLYSPYYSKESYSFWDEDLPLDLSDSENHEKTSDPDTCRIIPFSELIIHKKFKRVIIFSLPKEMISEVKGTPQRVTRSSNESHQSPISKVIEGKSEDRITHRLRKRKSDRINKLQSKNSDQCNIKSEPEEDNVDINDFDDILGCLSDDVSGATPRRSFDQEVESLIESAFEESRLSLLNKKREEALSIQKRVAEWHARIQPTLEKAEQRSRFDPDEYGTRLINKFQNIGETRPLKEIIDTEEYNEVSRYLLSTLALANTGNFEIIKLDSSDLARDCYAVKFINATRHHDLLNASIGETTAGEENH